MTDPPARREPDDIGTDDIDADDVDADDFDATGYDDESSGGIPRWIKVAGIILAVLVLLAVAMLAVGGGHSPRRHGSGGTGGPVPADTTPRRAFERTGPA
jgi:hypothetical protein